MNELCEDRDKKGNFLEEEKIRDHTFQKTNCVQKISEKETILNSLDSGDFDHRVLKPNLEKT